MTSGKVKNKLSTVGVVIGPERKLAFSFLYNGLGMVLAGLIPVALFSGGEGTVLPTYLFITCLSAVILGLLFVVKAAVEIRDYQRRQDLWGTVKLPFTIKPSSPAPSTA